MKQITMSVLMYTTDWDEELMRNVHTIRPPYLPECTNGGSGGATFRTCYMWAQQVYPYIRNRGLFSCPSWSTNETFIVGLTPPVAKWSYTIPMASRIHDDLSSWMTTCPVCSRTCLGTHNVTGMGAGTPNRPDRWQHDAAGTILLIELKSADRDGWSGQSWHTYWTRYYERPTAHVHNDGDNYAFYDGHAKWLLRPDIGLFTICETDNR
ncbi:MAG: hypothetical protein ACE5JM_16640 [Armatimonadota bacterium]